MFPSCAVMTTNHSAMTRCMSPFCMWYDWLVCSWPGRKYLLHDTSQGLLLSREGHCCWVLQINYLAPQSQCHLVPLQWKQGRHLQSLAAHTKTIQRYVKGCSMAYVFDFGVHCPFDAWNYVFMKKIKYAIFKNRDELLQFNKSNARSDSLRMWARTFSLWLK